MESTRDGRDGGSANVHPTVPLDNTNQRVSDSQMAEDDIHRSIQQPRTPPPSDAGIVPRTVALSFATVGSSQRDSNSQTGSNSNDRHLAFYGTFINDAVGYKRSSSSNAGPPDTISSMDSTIYQGATSTSRSLINSASIEAMGRVSSTGLFSTPHSRDSHRSYANDRTVQGQGKSIMTTMGEIPVASLTWTMKKFTAELKISQIGTISWLRATIAKQLGLFTFQAGPNKNSTRWVIIPEKPTLERQLYEPFVQLITAVLDKHLKAIPGVKREVVDMHNKHIPHIEGHYTSPDIVICGVGPSFEAPLDGKLKVTYANIVACFDIKLEREMNREDNIEQMTVYIRQIMAHKPNRLRVDALLISEKSVQLLRFDRAGLQATERYDLHDRYTLFVGLLVGLSNTVSERSIGLDDSIQWEHDAKGRKAKETMTCAGPDENKRYDLVDKDPVSHNQHIRGDATVCWIIRDPDTQKEYLVKDSWSSQGRTPEWELLQRANAKGIKGVCRIIWYKERVEVRQWRDGTEEYFNRKSFRVVTEKYGQEIHNFESAHQALSAIRDTVAAHGNLYGIGILHRDISNKTILLGREDAPVGEQGILIDLSLAFDFHTGADSSINDEPIMGRRFFQSCMRLDFLTDLNEEYERELAPAHDYLDDLESFFDVLCFLMFQYGPDGKEREKGDKAKSVVEGWDSEKAKYALASKALLINPARRHAELAADLILESWGKVCRDLFEQFLEWVWSIQVQKGILVRGYRKWLREKVTNEVASGELTRSRLETQAEEHLESIFAPLYREAQTHYEHVIGLFQTAIDALDASPAGPEPAPKVQIPVNLKRRRRESIHAFKVPDIPDPKVRCLDNGLSQPIRASSSGSSSRDPFEA